ncbi:hypothetical protein OF66_2451 [Seleniivibrio woodruffii]|uniref:Uncharacterized protein n=2 Tax=Seleniivibrio woodruffii TaxID=1078050 RepID=A0A4R1K3G8_9BACT|nr:hypothetical protein C8D98_2642 [Seleniivibrio woodruffii]TVZ36813.1 hypothetical protein OF66_2451 [Seleniivibrio woodruffii]
MKQVSDMIVRLVIIVGISAIMLGGYHTFIVKKYYVRKSEIYVVDTNKILQKLAERVYQKTLTTDELRKRVEELQTRISNHEGIVFEMGALPGKVDNDIQNEFEDLVEK